MPLSSSLSPFPNELGRSICENYNLRRSEEGEGEGESEGEGDDKSQKVAQSLVSMDIRSPVIPVVCGDLMGGGGGFRLWFGLVWLRLVVWLVAFGLVWRFSG